MKRLAPRSGHDWDSWYGEIYSNIAKDNAARSAAHKADLIIDISVIFP
jgi:hypothetical protein